MDGDERRVINEGSSAQAVDLTDAAVDLRGDAEVRRLQVAAVVQVQGIHRQRDVDQAQLRRRIQLRREPVVKVHLQLYNEPQSSLIVITGINLLFDRIDSKNL